MSIIDQPTALRALEPSVYASEDIFARERQLIFNRSWRLVGHENMLPQPGDYLSDSIAGTSIIVVRNDAGDLNAFHNLCRHRAGPLVTEAQGRCEKELTCKYHGWRYTLDGRLRSARDFGAANNFDPRDFGLLPVSLNIWRGFIFVNLSEDAGSPATEMAAVETGWSAHKSQPFAFRRSHDIACNWKTYVENYLEGYHVPDVHPGLDKDIDSSAYRVETIGLTAVHHAPPRQSDGVYAGYWAWVWPWLGVNVYQHGVMMERISPLSATKTRLDYLYFFDPDRGDELKDMMALSDEVTAEDKNICEQVQRNLVAGFYTPGLLSPKHENAVALFQNQLRQTMGYV